MRSVDKKLIIFYMFKINCIYRKEINVFIDNIYNLNILRIMLISEKKFKLE